LALALALPLLTFYAPVSAQLVDVGDGVELPPPAGVPNGYGAAVAIDGDFAIVGAPATGSGTEAGSVYVFDGGLLVQTIRSGAGAGAAFGASLAVQPGELLVGAPGDLGGAAYLYERVDGEYEYVDRLTPSAPSRGFAQAVALLGSAVYVSAPLADVGGETGNGAVHRFIPNAGDLREAPRIDGPAIANAGFGLGIAAASGRVLVGAPRAGANGSVYVFDRDGALQDTITPTDVTVERNRGFGEMIVAEGDRFVSTVRGDTDDTFVGTVLIYEFDGASWNETQRLRRPGASLFGLDIALSGSTLLVRDFDMGVSPVSVFVYRFSGGEWREGGEIILPVRSLRSAAIDGLSVVVGRQGGPDSAFRYALTLLPDTDDDGVADADDEDDDNDGVLDGDDTDHLDPMVCRDTDADTCDDCSTGSDGFGPMSDFDPAMDGPDDDDDGVCDVGDLCTGDDSLGDPDGDGVCGEAGDADAGPMADAGSDAGPSGSDAGPSGSDAGPSGLDGGTADAGSTMPPEDSSGCAVGGSSSPTWFAAFALMALWRRRRTRR
ncbi:MAG: MYXO-CTERM sorting domain-containing protein, partial [Polyangiales bacterium]